MNFLSTVIAGAVAVGVANGNVVSESDWMMDAFSGLKFSENPYLTSKEIFGRVSEMAKEYQAKEGKAEPSEYPYWNFLPQIRGAAVPGDAAVEWSGVCFRSNSAVASAVSETGEVKLSISSSDPISDDCVDDYKLMTVSGHRYLSINEVGTAEIVWSLPADASDAEKWDIQSKGIRIFNFATDIGTTVANILETVLLFIPEFTQQVDPASAKRNVDFMNRYPQVLMESRDPLENVPPEEHKVHSGDFFGVIRLDGLDPMLAWAMGSTTGHTTTALWIDEELYIVESTAIDSYWDVNGIQKTPYREWLHKAEQAGYNVVWAPLNKQNRAKYNETAAVEFFKSTEGLDYGFRNMLFGWIDTETNNYPCLPGDYSSLCLQWEFVETFFGNLDRVSPDTVDLLFNQAFNLRLGTSGLRFAETLQEADKQGISAKQLPAIVEDDKWVYNTTRYGEPVQGRSMVCCVFVCHTWKAAGLFDDLDVNCGEMTNADDYGLALFEDEYTQILGRWTLDFNRYNIKKPYEHMGETCSSLAPNYEQAPDC